jgi:hypothetical protein
MATTEGSTEREGNKKKEKIKPKSEKHQSKIKLPTDPSSEKKASPARDDWQGEALLLAALRVETSEAFGRFWKGPSWVARVLAMA